MSEMILSTINPDDLIEKIARRTAEILRSETQEKEELLTREGALELLKCSPATLWRNEAKGKIQGHGIGGRRYYKKSELVLSLKQKTS